MIEKQAEKHEKCPGSSNILMPTIKLKTCPECGGEVEVVSTDMQTNCPDCGFTTYNNVVSCVQWCAFAKECLGEQLYERLLSAVSK